MFGGIFPWRVMRACALVLGVVFATGPVSPISAQQPVHSYVIALSDSFEGSAWRAQMEREVQAEALTPQDRRLVRQLIINNSGNDVHGQAAEIRTLVNQRVSAILVDASSKRGLNSALATAHRHHIPVVSFDNPVTSPYARRVTYSNTTWGATGARFLVKTLHGRGRVILLENLKSPTGGERMEGATRVFHQFPGIRVVARINGNGDAPGGRRAVQQLLAAHRQFDAIWSSGGMTEGVVPALLAARLRLVPMTDASSFGWLEMLHRYGKKGLHGIGVGDVPWSGAAALNVALGLLEQEQVPHSITLPIQAYSADDPVVRSHPNLPHTFNVDFSSPVLGSRAQLTVQDVLTGICCHR